jgi:hypothetical protein
VAALVAALFYYRHIDRQRRERAASRTPHAVAIGQLERLEGEAANLFPNQFALELSAIIKDFLHARHGDRFRFETAEEFLARAHDGRALSLPPATRDSMLAFVDRCDEIKFGRPADAAEKCSPLYQAARRVVETSPPTATQQLSTTATAPDPHVTPSSTAG